MDKILEISDLQCGYASDFGIHIEKVQLNRGDFYGIIGPNGAGKTTLFRGITGELVPQKGNISFMGEDLFRMKRDVRAQHMAIVNQNVGTPMITVEDYVLLGRLPYRHSLSFWESSEDHAIADHYMQLTDTYRFKDKMMNELSGGEQQLAAIARALTQQPDLLLLDEPTSHLDISHSIAILNLLQDLNKQQQLTIMMVIHDLNMAGEYCEDLLMMKDGKVFTSGKPDDVLTYQNIEKVHNAVVITQNNPLSGRPAVFPVSQRMMKTHKESL